MGIREAQTNLAYNQAFNKVISGGILRDMKTLLGGWAGQVRNAVINLMNKASASSANTIGANQAILDIADKFTAADENIGRLTNLYRQGAKFDQQGNPVIGKDGNYVFEQGRQPTSAESKRRSSAILAKSSAFEQSQSSIITPICWTRLKRAVAGWHKVPYPRIHPLPQRPLRLPGRHWRELQQEKARRQQQQKAQGPAAT